MSCCTGLLYPGKHDTSDDFWATEPCSSTELCSYEPEFTTNQTLYVLWTCPVYGDISVVVYIHRVYTWYIRYVYSTNSAARKRWKSQKWRPQTTIVGNTTLLNFTQHSSSTQSNCIRLSHRDRLVHGCYVLKQRRVPAAFVISIVSTIHIQLHKLQTMSVYRGIQGCWRSVGSPIKFLKEFSRVVTQHHHSCSLSPRALPTATIKKSKLGESIVKRKSIITGPTLI